LAVLRRQELLDLGDDCIRIVAVRASTVDLDGQALLRKGNVDVADAARQPALQRPVEQIAAARQPVDSILAHAEASETYPQPRSGNCWR